MGCPGLEAAAALLREAFSGLLFSLEGLGLVCSLPL